MVDIKTNERKNSPEIFWQELRLKSISFGERVVDFARELGLNIDNLQIDHMGMRFANPEDVDFLRQGLNKVGGKISEAIVNGRPILIYKLNRPLSVDNFEIPCVELPYPAQKHDFPSDGWEHLEFVLPDSGSDIEKTFKSRYPKFKGDYKIDEPKVEGEQLPNPTIILKHPTNKMLTLKFHGHSIEEVVRSKS